jgi:hypothetical protein
MSKPDGYKAALLDFLTDNIVGRERDAVIRAFYEYAEGDPQSHPVGIAVLLTACSRQMARLPDNLQSGAREFQGILDKLIEVDKDLATKIANHQLQWKKDLNGAINEFMGGIRGETSRTVTALDEGNAQAEAAWKEAAERLAETLKDTDQVSRRLIPIADSASKIALLFSSLKVELELHKESHQRAIDAVESVKVIHQENQQQGQDTQALIRALSKEARANWMTIGYLTGIFLAALFYRMPWWGTWICFAAILGLLQWLSRWSGKAMPPITKEPAENLADPQTQAP